MYNSKSWSVYSLYTPLMYTDMNVHNLTYLYKHVIPEYRRAQHTAY